MFFYTNEGLYNLWLLYVVYKLIVSTRTAVIGTLTQPP